MTLGLILASRLSAQGETVLVSGSTVVFGRGVGMVVQILVLAAQNSGATEILRPQPRASRYRAS